MKKFLMRIWELPQKLLAHIIILLFKPEPCGEYEDAKLYFWNFKGGMSLSTHIFLPFGELTGSKWQMNYIKHEYGHSIQSKQLGLIYMIVIGMPSFFWAWLGDNYRKKNNIDYYSFYTERSADKLGGVKRGWKTLSSFDFLLKICYNIL